MSVTEEKDVGNRVLGVKGYLFFITRYMMLESILITRYMVLDTSLRMERSKDYEERVDFWKTIVDRLPMLSN